MAGHYYVMIGWSLTTVGVSVCQIIRQPSTESGAGCVG